MTGSVYRSKITATSRGMALPVLFLFFWIWMSKQGAVGNYVFVPAEQIFNGASETLKSGELEISIMASVSRAIAGLLVGSLIGIILGTSLALSRLADVVISPIFNAIRQIPVIGLIPLISLWFGNGESSKLLIISLAAFYPMVIASHRALKMTDQRYDAVADIYQITGWSRLRHVVFPAAMPAIFAGLMQALVFTWISAIGTELFFSPAPGIGSMMTNAQTAFRMDIMLVCVLVIGAVGYVINALISRLSLSSLTWRDTRRI